MVPNDRVIDSSPSSCKVKGIYEIFMFWRHKRSASITVNVHVCRRFNNKKRCFKFDMTIDVDILEQTNVKNNLES